MQHPDFDTKVVRLGKRGLWLAGDQDQVPPEACRVYTNLRSIMGGPSETRLGYSVLGSGAGAVDVHSIVRVDDPARSVWTRYFGAGTALWAGKDSGSGFVNLSGLIGGISGDPLTLLAYRSVLTGDPWLILVDSTNVWKIRYLGGAAYEAIELGLTPPSSTTASELSDILTTGILAFDPSDASEAANWTAHPGFDFGAEGDPVTEDPEINDIPDGSAKSGPAVEFVFKAGDAAAEGYYSWVAKPLTKDLTKLQIGSPSETAASDADYVHLWLKCSDPAFVEEIRIYFVVSDGFDPTIIPGSDPDINTEAYVKALRPSDFQGWAEVVEDALGASRRARRNQDQAEYYDRGGDAPAPPIVFDPTAPQDPFARSPDLGFEAPAEPSPTPTYTTPGQAGPRLVGATDQLQLGRGAWSEWGVPGRPLRRGDWTRIGSNEDRTWATVTGVIIALLTNTNEDVGLICDDWYLTGGFGPDTGEAAAIPYDYRHTHYDSRSGAESNPSPIQADDARLEPFRNRVTLTADGYGNSYMRQRYYRRGGFLADHWYFVGQSESDGGEVVDTFADAAIQNAGRVDLDNYRPVQSVDLTGAGVRSNLKVIFGPLDGHVIGIGDPYRPGHIFWSKPENPDAWPLVNQTEVCAPGDELLNGCIWGQGGFVFSRRRAYALLSDGQGNILPQNTEISPGLVAKMGLAVTPLGVAYVSHDGIRLTAGGAAKLISVPIDPLFRGETVSGYNPIDLTAEDQIQLHAAGHELVFLFQDSEGGRVELRYDLIDEQWRFYQTANRFATAHYEATSKALLFGGVGTGAAYLEGGTTDAGAAINIALETGDLDLGDAKKDKKLGDIILDADIPTGTTLLMTTYLNNRLVTNPTLVKNGLDGRRRLTYDPFGLDPQRARNLAVLLTLSTTTRAQFWLLGVSVVLDPDMTFLRATTWEQMGPDGGMGYVTGCTITVDTNNQDKTFSVDYAFGVGSQPGSTDIQSAATLVINSGPAHRRMHFSWPAVRADQIRLRPIDPCLPIILYKVEWHVEPEPPYVSKWDTNHEAKGDQYHTGLDIVCDTYGQTKTINVFVDGILQINPATLTTSFPVAATGKQLVHLTFGPGRGHIYRFVAVDAIPGHLYTWHWHLDPEPSEQTNWNQNFTPGGSLSDKWIKGVILECDTYGETKSLQVQVDGVIRETVPVVQNGRGAVHISFSDQYLGRMLRLLPVDNFPGRIYQPPDWLFDLEPYSLRRWETQELDWQLGTWFMPLGAMVTLRADADVALRAIGYHQDGAIVQDVTYTIPATGVQKTKRWVPFQAMKCVFVKFIVTSPTPFALHREESHVRVMIWGTQSVLQKPFGNDDLDPARSMGKASIAAATPGGA